MADTERERSEELDELAEKIPDYIANRRYSELKQILTEMNPADIGDLMGSLPTKSLPPVFRLLPKELASEVFVYIDSDAQEQLISTFSDSELKEVVDDLYIDDTVDIIEEMPATVVKRILKHADSDMRLEINKILKYPKDSAGSVMTTEYVDLKTGYTVEDSFLRIRRTAVDKETIYTCYVTDDNRKLLGRVTVKDLLLSEYTDKVVDIMETNIIYVNTSDDREYVANMFARYDVPTIPVVDAEERLVGIVTFDDAMDVILDETTEDIEKMAAISPTDKPYSKLTALDLWKKRIPWLLLLMISATFTGMIISSFENALASVVVLTSFIPMLMDTGGNTGSQASVTVIRSISLGDIEFKNMPIIIWKEVRVALLCGGTLAVTNFAKLMLFDKMLLGNSDITLSVAFVVCSTLVLTVLCAKVIGCTLPMIAKKLGFDPAVMASPFITTIVDAVSLMVYFRIATVVLHLS
ncbi:MAG: magnesium transporter [Clostridia bacterium]|nr:magnesium transporter [Clostridia bacterium]